MLGHRKRRSVVRYTLQALAKTPPRPRPVSPMTAGFTVHKILGFATEMVTYSKASFRAS